MHPKVRLKEDPPYDSILLISFPEMNCLDVSDNHFPPTLAELNETLGQYLQGISP